MQVNPFAYLLEIIGLSLWAVVIFGITRLLLTVNLSQEGVDPLTTVLIKLAPTFLLGAASLFAMAWIIKNEDVIKVRYTALSQRISSKSLQYLAASVVGVIFVIVVVAIYYIDQAAINDAANRRELPAPSAFDSSTWSSSTTFGNPYSVSTGSAKNPYPLTENSLLNSRFAFDFDRSSPEVVVFADGGKVSCFVPRYEYLSGDNCRATNKIAPYRIRSIQAIDFKKMLGNEYPSIVESETGDYIIAVVDEVSTSSEVVSKVFVASRNSKLVNILLVDSVLSLGKEYDEPVVIQEVENVFYDAPGLLPNFTLYKLTSGSQTYPFGLLMTQERHVGTVTRLLPVSDALVAFDNPVTQYVLDDEGSYVLESKGSIQTRLPYRSAYITQYRGYGGYNYGIVFSTEGDLLYNQPACELSPSFSDEFFFVDIQVSPQKSLAALVSVSLAEEKSWNVTTPSYGYVPEQWGKILYQEPVQQYLDLVAAGKLPVKHESQVIGVDGLNVTHTLPYQPARPCQGVYEQYQWVRGSRLFTVDFSYADSTSLTSEERQVIERVVQSVVTTTRYVPRESRE